MDAETLRGRIAEREAQHRAMVQQQQALTNEVVGIQGAIIELKRLLAELEQESEDVEE